MKALLTGANGFLGKHLVSKLNSTGCKVYSLGRVKTENTNFFHLGSLEDKEKIKKCLSDIKPDYLFHLAGSVSNDEDESKKVNADFGSSNEELKKQKIDDTNIPVEISNRSFCEKRI